VWESYYLIARSSFKVDDAPLNNKGWKSRYFFASTFRGWGFGLKWTSRDIDNSSPLLTKDEVEQAVRMRGILSSSKAIKSISEDWLVEAGLSPALRGMAYLVFVAY
ncbi:hypothetical protein B296_00047862, partial [Ensete ventricosum]